MPARITHKISEIEQIIKGFVYGKLDIIGSTGMTRDEIVKYLKLPQGKVNEVLDFLISRGLVNQSDAGALTVGDRNIHLPKDSPLIGRHHSTWREQAVRRIELGVDSDLHYSSVICVSAQTAEKIREVLVTTIEECRTLTKSSKAKDVYVYNIDLFSLNQNLG